MTTAFIDSVVCVPNMAVDGLEPGRCSTVTVGSNEQDDLFAVSSASVLSDAHRCEDLQHCARAFGFELKNDVSKAICRTTCGV